VHSHGCECICSRLCSSVWEHIQELVGIRSKWLCTVLQDLSGLRSSHYDVVSCFNVLDRCSHPRNLLHELRRLTRPGGRVLLAVVLPFRPMVESGPGVVRHPEQRFDLDPNQDWEASVNRIVKRVLIPCGYEVERLSRVPYLCQGDVGSP